MYTSNPSGAFAYQARLRKSVTILLVIAVPGCASLLPKAESLTLTTWHSFDEAKHAIESIKPGQTRRPDLAAIGIEPYSNSSVTILTYPDILQRFAAGSSVSEQTLEPGILNCLKAGKVCNGYAIDQASTSRKRYGNFWVDLLNFRRQTDITGWRFNALIVLMGDLVVYASYGGQPSIHEKEATRNPLGPLQDYGGTVIIRALPSGGF